MLLLLTLVAKSINPILLLTVPQAGHRCVRPLRSRHARYAKRVGILLVGLREAGSLAAFKRQSRAGFLDGYGAFWCDVRSCYVCVPGEGVVGARSQRGMVAE